MLHKKLYLVMMFLLLLIIGIGGFASATGIVIEGASAIWEKSPQYPSELLTVATKVQPRIVAEYASTLFEQNIDYPERLLDVARGVPGRIVVEYASSIAQFDLFTP